MAPTPFTCRNNAVCPYFSWPRVSIFLSYSLISALRVAAKRTKGSSASRISTATASSPFCAKLRLEHLGSRVPMLLTKPRVVLMISVRAATKASRARSITRSSRTSRLRCWIGYNDSGSTRPNRASLFASIRSFLRLRRFDPSINLGLATSTSCPQPLMTSCTQAECVPTSTTTRAPFNPWKKVAKSSCAVRNCPSARVSPLPTQHTVVAPLVAQIHSHRQTVEIGAKLSSLILFSTRCCHLCRIQLCFQLSHQFRQHFFRIPLHRAPRLRPFRCPFTLLSRIVMLPI